MGMYESQIVTHPLGHSLTQSDRREAEQLFIEKATQSNPNGVQGNPQLLGVSLIVGQQATWTFGIELVEPLGGDDAAPNDSASDTEQSSDPGFTNGTGSTSGRRRA